MESGAFGLHSASALAYCSRIPLRSIRLRLLIEQCEYRRRLPEREDAEAALNSTPPLPIPRSHPLNT